MKRADLLVPALLFLLALGLRAYDLAHPPFLVLDEPGNVPAAAHYWNDGQFGPDTWEHPPLRNLTLHAFVRAFGDGPWGWRLRNVLFGALTAALTWLFALVATGQRRVALLAGLLLATDPLHVVLSRFTYEEIPGAAFFLAAALLVAARRRRSSWLVAAAALMGCALATKWYWVPGWAVLGLFALRDEGEWRRPGPILFIGTTWTLVPLSVYVLSFGPWFGRGYGLGELAEHTVSAYHSLWSKSPAVYPAASALLGHPSARDWFIAPAVLGQGTYLAGGEGEFLLFVNNLPIWIFTLPSLAGMAVVAWRRRAPGLALPALCFAASYLPLLAVKRPVFLYSAAPLLPFAFTGIAFGMDWLSERLVAKLYWVLLCAALAWNGYLYPLVTAKRIPVAAYRLILDDEDIRIH